MISILHSNRSFWPLMVIVVYFLLPAAATPRLAGLQELQQRADSAQSEPLDCTTSESSDYYGFGVRLGVYFTWLSSYFANTMLPREVPGSLDTNCIFLLALLASLFRGTLSHTLYQIDGLMVMHLSSGFLFSSLSIWGYRTLYYQNEGPKAIEHFGGWGTHIRLALITSISLYGAWFWWEGVEDGLKVNEIPECEQLWTWFFHTWKIGGGIHIYYIIVTIGCSIYFGIMCFVALLAWFLKIYRRGLIKTIRYQTGLHETEIKFLYLVLRLFNISWIVFCVLMIEMTLNSNHMLGVLAKHGKIGFPAQLIPLLIGALSFLRVLWLIFKEWLDDHMNHDEDDDIAPHRKIFALIPTMKRRQTTASVILHAKRHQGRHLILKNRYFRYTLTWMPWLAELLTHKASVPLDEEATLDMADEKNSPIGEETRKPTDGRQSEELE